jgi:hypothetical protein
MLTAWSAVLGLYSLFQLFALGYIRLTIRLRTLAYAILVGLYGCTAVAYVLEFIAVHTLAAFGVANPVAVASYTTDPLIEELVKVAPLILLALRAGSALGIADLVLLGAGTGLGFRLAEEWLRLSNGIDPHLPSPGALLGLLPSGQQANLSIDWGGHPYSVEIAGALVWSGLAGWAVGIWRRKGGRGWLGVPILVLAWVTLDHALVNFGLAQASGSTIAAQSYPPPLFAIFFADGFGGWMRYYLLAALLSAAWLDRRRSRGAAEAALPRFRWWPMFATLPIWIGFVIVFLVGTTPVVARPWTVKDLLANPLVPALFAIAGVLVFQSLRDFKPAFPEPGGEAQVEKTLWALLGFGLAGALTLGLAVGVSKGPGEFLLHGGAHLYQAAHGTVPASIVCGLAPGLQALVARPGSRRGVRRSRAAESSA